MVSQFSVAKRKSTHKQDVVSLERRVFYRHHTQRYRYIPGYEIRCSSLFLGGMVVYVVLVHFMHVLVDSLRSFSLAGDGDDWWLWLDTRHSMSSISVAFESALALEHF